MSNNWVEEFGFSKNPYDTRALSAKDGASLLYGREKEENWLIQQLVSNNTIPLLVGDNGVGKTSIANVVAYKLKDKYNEGNVRFFSLLLNHIPTNSPHFMDSFEKYLYGEVFNLLFRNKDFLLTRGISQIEIQETYSELAANQNPFWLGWKVKEWLAKCFNDPFGGGIICIIDNLENCGKALQVQKMLEIYRDTLFNIPGILWVLCGTKYAVNTAQLSPRLYGYISPLEIKPIQLTLAPELIKQRIEHYGNELSDPPVSQTGFEFLYEIMNCQLRNALTLCVEFAEHLFYHKPQRDKDRLAELNKWIRQKSVLLPARENEICDASWELFDSILSIGTELSNTEYELCNIHNKNEFDALSSILVEKRLFHRIETDDGYLLKLTIDGSLVSYKRRFLVQD